MLRRTFHPWFWAPIVFVVDFVTKRLVLAQEEAFRAKIHVIGDLARFIYVRNPGSAMGLFPVGRLTLIGVSILASVFLLGEGQRYLELEFGPHGHHLALRLRGSRNLEESGLPLEYEARQQGDRWTGHARVPLAHLPPGLRAANAYAIHGRGPGRRYLAADPVPGAVPDFHRLGCFRPLVWRAEEGG